MNEHAVLTIATILVAGLACHWLAWRLRLPAIIFLLACGILAGPVLGWLNPDQLLGDLLFPFVSLAVAVILFEGSLTLKLRDLPGLEQVIRRLISIGVLVTTVITAMAAHWLLDFSWPVAALFGAIMSVTGPTVIAPLLRSVRPSENVAQVLRWEGILIDPIGALLAVLVFEFIVAGGAEHGIAASLLVFGELLVTGVALGCASGLALGLLLRHYLIPYFLRAFAVLAAVCMVMALANSLVGESGLLAVTVMGIWLANMRNVELDEIIHFKESLSLLLISALFITLAGRMQLGPVVELGWPALGLFALLQFVARPLSIQLCALGTRLSMAERHLLGWIAPRGIIAAAISALFALRLGELGYAEAPLLVPLTFLIIIGTVVLQSITARPLARLLGVAEPDAKGFLIVGANRVALAIANSLASQGQRVLLADKDWSAVANARMSGLPVYWGNPVSEHAERHLDLRGIGNLLAITPQVELNALAAHYYRSELEPSQIFTIHNESGEKAERGKKSKFRRGGRRLFGTDVSYQQLESLLANGHEIHNTTLSTTFTWTHYLEQGDRIPLFAIDPSDTIHIFTPDRELSPKPDWQIIGVTPALDKVQPTAAPA